MKEIKLWNLIKLKHKETNIKWRIVFPIWIFLFYVSILIINHYTHDIVDFSLKTALALAIRVMISANIETLTVFILTPRKLTYKSSNVLIMIMLTITYLMRLLMLPLVFLFGTAILKIITVTVHIFRLYYMYCIKKTYCPTSFKRGYILVMLEALNLIFQIKG